MAKSYCLFQDNCFKRQMEEIKSLFSSMPHVRGHAQDLKNHEWHLENRAQGVMGLQEMNHVFPELLSQLDLVAKLEPASLSYSDSGYDSGLTPKECE